MNTNPKQAILFFVIGFVVCSLLHRQGRHFGGFMGPKPPSIERMIERFSKDLDLSPEQKEKVGAIIRTKRERIDQLRKEVRPKFDQIWSESNAEISALLNDDQKKKFEKLEERMQKKREARRAARERDILH